jgi:hypothetical protein
MLIIATSFNFMLASQTDKSLGADAMSKMCRIKGLVQVRHVGDYVMKRSVYFATLRANTAIHALKTAFRPIVVINAVVRLWRQILNIHCKFTMKTLPGSITFTWHHEVASWALASICAEMDISHSSIGRGWAQ